MKKMKGVAAATTFMEYSPYAAHEDQRMRFKRLSLMQDFEDLHKETDAMRKKLQMMKERKMTLLAEVRFLRRRHKFLMQNQNTRAEQNLLQASKMVIPSKSNIKVKKTTGKEHALRHLATGFDLNQTGKTFSKKEPSFAHPSLTFDLNQKQQKIFNMDEVALRSSLPILDLNQRGSLYSGKETAARRMTPVFDLNQMAREEEEMQANDNPLRIEELKKSSIRDESEEQHNDIKISAFWNTGNGPSRVGKRKISWQEPVVVRV